MKVYEKPRIYAESFVLTEHIADRCALDTTPEGMPNGTPNYGNSESCSFYINNGAVALFLSSMPENQTCVVVYNENTILECYNNFESASNLFSS